MSMITQLPKEAVENGISCLSDQLIADIRSGLLLDRWFRSCSIEQLDTVIYLMVSYSTQERSWEALANEFGYVPCGDNPRRLFSPDTIKRVVERAQVALLRSDTMKRYHKK